MWVRTDPTKQIPPSFANVHYIINISIILLAHCNFIYWGCLFVFTVQTQSKWQYELPTGLFCFWYTVQDCRIMTVEIKYEIPFRCQVRCNMMVAFNILFGCGRDSFMFFKNTFAESADGIFHIYENPFFSFDNCVVLRFLWSEMRIDGSIL